MPVRLQDYVIILDDVPSDENIINFVLFANCDPVVYEEAASDDRWMKVMEKEIHTIEMVREKEIEVDYCKTKEKVTDIFLSRY